MELRRVAYTSVRDGAALEAFQLLSVTEGIIPALESAHALALLLENKEDFLKQIVIVNLSGRGDKDVETVSELLGAESSQ
jgi:tryptophan synthase beta chain